MKTDPAIPTRLIDSPTLAVILAIVAAAIVLIILAYSNPSADETQRPVSFDDAPPVSAPAPETAAASREKRQLISVATRDRNPRDPSRKASTTKEIREHWPADEFAADTTPGTSH